MEAIRENDAPRRDDLKKHGINNKHYNEKVPVMSDKEYEDLLITLNGGRNCGGCSD